MGLAPYNPDGYIVIISENALIEMCLSSLEAYSVSHKGNSGYKTGLEAYGLLFGHESALPNGKTVYCIEFVSVDTSTERERDCCTPNHKALELKRDLLTSFFPQYEFIGDFHSHPCREAYRKVVKHTYRFSPADYLHVEGNSDFWMQHGYRCGIVITITLLKNKTKSKNRWIDSSTIEFTLGNYRLFLKGYVAALDEDEEKIELVDEKNMNLYYPALLGLVGEFTRFGRGIQRPGLRHVCGKI